MKKYLIVLGFIVDTVHAQQPKPTGFRIEGHIRGLADKSGVTLTDANKPSDTLARATVKDGVFILTGNVTEPNLYVLNFSPANKKTTLFIGNESVQVKGNIDNLSDAVVSGSPSETDFSAF